MDKLSEKILPISLQKEFNHLLGYAFPLCILLNNEKNLGWYYENYIETYAQLRKGYQIRFDVMDVLSYKEYETKIMETSRVDLIEASRIKSIEKEIIRKLKADKYIIIFLDQYYIMDSDAYNLRHYPHEVLIYGYKDEMFKAIAFDKNRIFNKINITHKELQSSFQNVLNKKIWTNETEIEENIIYYFNIIDQDISYPFNFNEFIEKLDRYHKSKIRKKDFYSLSDISEYLTGKEDIKIIFPKIDKYKGIYLNKYHVIGKPVLGVAGTSSRQGKYTLQLKLRKKMQERGYRVGQLGTEPTGLLFGFDAVYPMGYESNIKVKGIDAVKMVNSLMGAIEKKDPDIILFGSQSQTIPNQVGGEKEYPIAQHELILGTQADAYILCVNVDDEIEYIKRTIAYLEAIISSKVIALVVFPMENTARWSVLSHRKDEIESQRLEKERDRIAKEIKLKTYILNQDNEIERLTNHVEEFFSQ